MAKWENIKGKADMQTGTSVTFYGEDGEDNQRIEHEGCIHYKYQLK